MIRANPISRSAPWPFHNSDETLSEHYRVRCHLRDLPIDAPLCKSAHRPPAHFCADGHYQVRMPGKSGMCWRCHLRANPIDAADWWHVLALATWWLHGTKPCTAVCKQSVNAKQRKKPTTNSVAGFLYLAWRREWDSNPRYLAVRLISSQVHSATLPSLRGMKSGLYP